MNTQHTPGPWTLTQFSAGAEIYGMLHGQYQLIAQVASFRNDDPEGNANARLIAAAPELLKALESLLNAVKEADEGWAGSSPIAKQARAAIAKAKGEA